MIKTALVSFGMSGRVFHAPFIDFNPNFMLAGAWERSSKNIQSVYPGVTSYASYDEILSDPSIDLVVVNSPNDTHFDYTKQALLAGKHVVVEKSFTVTVEEAEELAALAVQQQKVLTVYQNRRYDADFLTIQKLIKEDAIGEFLDIQIWSISFNINCILIWFYFDIVSFSVYTPIKFGIPSVYFKFIVFYFTAI
jgi:predicted dehydrogenase